MISSSSSWITTQMEVLSATTQSIMFTKGPVITVLTNVGSPVSLRRRSERHLIAHCFFLARERHHLGVPDKRVRRAYLGFRGRFTWWERTLHVDVRVPRLPAVYDGELAFVPNDWSQDRLAAHWAIYIYM